jgi:geranylgeranyl pyrophosphate synthase
MVQMKTGALFQPPRSWEPSSSGASPAVISALKNYGNKVGIAYQVHR